LPSPLPYYKYHSQSQEQKKMKNTRAIKTDFLLIIFGKKKPILTVPTQLGFLQINLLLFFLKKLICIKLCWCVHVVKFQNNYKTNGPAHFQLIDHQS